ncbi:MAG: MFS transporter [Prolixibacteraceae bacterium]|nr:MFS transporter [Prolixibacteraceae bacterium]
MVNKLFKESNLYIIFGITLFAVMGVASITPTFPQVIRHYNLTAKQIGYLITVFTFPGIFTTLFLGILADRFGRKAILIPSMLLFGIAGFLCVFQISYEGLLIMRFFQGIGAGSLGALNVTLIGDLWEGNKRTLAMGYNASVLSIGTASFPAIGGLLAASDWRYAFGLPILILPLSAIVFFRLKTPPVKKDIALKEYITKVWNTIKQKKALGLFAVNILVFIILYGAFLSFFPLLMEERFQANSKVIGIALSIASVTTAVFSILLGKVRKHFKPHTLMYFSSLVYMASLTVLAFAGNWFLLIIAILLFGTAHGFFIPNIQTVLVGFAPLSERAAFMALNGMVLRIGQTLGPVLAALFYINKSLRPVFLLNAVIALMIVVILKTVVGKLE